MPLETVGADIRRPKPKSKPAAPAAEAEIDADERPKGGSGTTTSAKPQPQSAAMGKVKPTKPRPKPNNKANSKTGGKPTAKLDAKANAKSKSKAAPSEDGSDGDGGSGGEGEGEGEEESEQLPKFDPLRDAPIESDSSDDGIDSDDSGDELTAAELAQISESGFAEEDENIPRADVSIDEVALALAEARELETEREKSRDFTPATATATAGSGKRDTSESAVAAKVAAAAAKPLPAVLTSRLALCNMDWAQVQAVDILVLLKSFLPSVCTVKNVAIYKSEFGKQRMEEESKFGPRALFTDGKSAAAGDANTPATAAAAADFKKKSAKTKSDEPLDSDEEDRRAVYGESDDETEKPIDMERVRAYEKERLRYYYAVIECDNPRTAALIYKEV